MAARAKVVTDWRQGAGYAGCCTEQALRRTIGDAACTDWTDAHRTFCRAAGLPGGDAALLTTDLLDGIHEWNDAPGRTHTEVLAAFDTAISYAQAAEQEFSADACELVDPYDYWTPELIQDVLDQHGEGPQR